MTFLAYANHALSCFFLKNQQGAVNIHATGKLDMNSSFACSQETKQLLELHLDSDQGMLSSGGSARGGGRICK